MSVVFFKQKTAHEMRISDWSSDVCSSDLSPCRANEALLIRLHRRNARAHRQPTGDSGFYVGVVEDQRQRRRNDMGGGRSTSSERGRRDIADIMVVPAKAPGPFAADVEKDRQSTRLNSSH